MQPRRADAFPRTGAAGPGCQAATVADGRREPETDAPRWRKCASWMQGGPTNGRRKPATGGCRAGGRARDAKGGASLPPVCHDPSNTHQVKLSYQESNNNAILSMF